VSLVDLNRSGVPLMEIVGDPDLRSPVQARDYLMALRQVLRYAGVSSGNMRKERSGATRTSRFARVTAPTSARRLRSRI
jgi:Asp-tRNA(Asn)/Glu-tRNA(Gln) amidotransferase B subunit